MTANLLQLTIIDFAGIHLKHVRLKAALPKGFKKLFHCHNFFKHFSFFSAKIKELVILIRLA